jgi:serine/threonine protein phosphatase PrpC
MRIGWGAASHTGARRPVNEDSFCVRPDLGLYLVADGMGGHAAGEVASRLAVETVAECLEISAAGSSPQAQPDDPSLGAAGSRLKAALAEANRRIGEEAFADVERRGMATTASALLIPPEGDPVVAHVGDSRIYLWREGILRRVTTDHSWVETQVRAGLMDERTASAHPWRNIVMRALSGSEPAEIDVFPLALAAGDWVILCSDGLSGVVRDDRIAEAIGLATDPTALCEHLVELANDGGGPDNITVVALHIDGA